MELEFINVNQICSLRCIPLRKSNSYKYIESKTRKSLFGKVWSTAEGFDYYDTFYSIKELENSPELIVKGTAVFYRPYIEIKMSNQQAHNKKFDTNEDMFKFIFNSKLTEVDWINKKDILESRDVLLEKHKGYPDGYRIFSKRILERGY